MAAHLCSWAKQGVELIVSDDGSSDAARAEQIAKDNGAKYVWQPDKGFRQPSAFQRGLDEATGYFVLFSDVDALPDRDIVSSYVDAWVPSALCLGERYFREHNQWVEDERPWDGFALKGLDKAIWYVSASNMFMERDILNELGGWCTEYDKHYAFADHDIGFRWWTSGRRYKYVPDAIVRFNEPRGGKPKVTTEAQDLFKRRICDLGYSHYIQSTPQ